MKYELSPPDLMRIWIEGCNANDRDKRIMRGSEKGKISENPYLPPSDEWHRWMEAYNFRSMVNDG